MRPPIVEADVWRQQRWRGLSAMRTPAPNTWVHHGGAGAVATPTLSVLRGYERYHVGTLGWRAIGYSFAYGRPFVTDEHGIVWATIYVCRDWGKEGGHTYGHNSTSHGHLFIGGWSNHTPPAPMINSLAWNIRDGARAGYATLELTGGHRDAARLVGRSTACPGDGGMAALPGVQALLEADDLIAALSATADTPNKDDIVAQLPTVRRRTRTSTPPLAQPYDPDRRVQGLAAAAGTLELAPNIEQLPGGRFRLDGKFGPSTKRAIEEAQRQAGLAMTGVVDDATWRVLLGVS